MNKDKQKALENAGYIVGDAEQFLVKNTVPKQYILDEWDSMCARANKALHSDCPLLEDEVLVEMHKYVSSIGCR